MTTPPSTPARRVPSLGTPLPPDLERLARAWLRYMGGDVGAASADRQLRTAIERSASQAWMIVGRLLELASSPELCARIGAGPLEWTLDRHGDEIVARLETAALHSPARRIALDAARPAAASDGLRARLDLVRERLERRAG